MASASAVAPSEEAEKSIESGAGSAGAAFRPAVRIQESVLAKVEKRVLLWLAGRLPNWVSPDLLTLFGFSGMCFACATYSLARWHRAGFLLAVLGLAANWFGDSLDGTLARFRNSQRPRYGYYVDHVIDSAGAILLMGGFAASGALDWRIAAGMLIAFLLLSIESYLATYTLGEFHLSFWKFGPTEIRVLLSAASVALYFNSAMRVPGLPYRVLDFGGAIAIGGMLAMFFASAISHISRLYRAETRRLRG